MPGESDAFDVVIVGGGFAGSALGAVLSARGFRIAICDPHEVHPRDFRAEKFSVDQIDALRAANHAEVTLHVYEGGNHGFNCDSRADHQPELAAIARERSLAFLKTNIA